MGIDIQQVSIATLIIALGLLVDMPVVAGDAIKRELGQGSPRSLAAWIGPSKLAKAIIFATITNIVAYLPFLLLTGDTYFFLYSLPVVMSVTLVASVIVSFTFIPLVAYYLIKPPKQVEEPMAERRKHGFAGFYYRVGDFALRHRWAVFAGSLSILVVGWLFMSRLHPQFFPKDLSYLSYVDVWAPSDAPLAATNAVAHKAEAVIREEAERFGEEHHAKDVLKTLTTFVGGGGPRFWFSVDPERRQLNYAQILVEVSDKHFTNELVGPLQTALSREVPGARIDIRQLETGKPVGIPISIRISGADTEVLHRLSSELQAIFRAQPGASRVRDDWGEPTMTRAAEGGPRPREPLRRHEPRRRALVRRLGERAAGLDLPGGGQADPDRGPPAHGGSRRHLRHPEQLRLLDDHQQAGAADPGLEGHHGDDDSEDQAAEPVPHRHGVGVPDPGAAAVPGAHAD